MTDKQARTYKHRAMTGSDRQTSTYILSSKEYPGVRKKPSSRPDEEHQLLTPCQVEKIPPGLIKVQSSTMSSREVPGGLESW